MRRSTGHGCTAPFHLRIGTVHIRINADHIHTDTLNSGETDVYCGRNAIDT
ncbi:MAG: hypothetical protein IPG74_07875 [Flavobacteriales bacterium]|nr:hypothetical protein [Flavobacteriales bacterium]MBK9195606.1 hypothetical protein [Flavobacteriales bacterium]MBP6574674.1 hypothetical protein [Flavobacteriales bacterium]